MTRSLTAARVLAAGLSYAVAPVQFGLGMTIAVPRFDRPENWGLVYALAAGHLVAVTVYRRLRPVGGWRRTVVVAYAVPLAAAFALYACHQPEVGRTGAGVVAALIPTPAPPGEHSQPFGVEPPRAAPTAGDRLLAGRLADWAYELGAALVTFAARVWVGTPGWVYGAAAVAGWWKGRRQ